MYEITLRHRGLNKYRVIRGKDRYVVEEKARVQEAAWAEQWQKQLDIEAQRQSRAAAAFGKEVTRPLL